MTRRMLSTALAALLAQTSLGADTFSFRAALEEARRSSPGLAAAREQAGIARGEAYQALTPYDPRLVGEYNYNESDQPNANPLFASQGNGHLSRLSLMTDLPLGAKVSMGLSGTEINDLTDRSGLGASAAFFAPASPAYNTEFFLTYRQSLLKDLWWFSGINTIRAGLARIEGARLRTDRAEAETLGNVTNAYAGWAAASENAEVAHSSWKEAEDFFIKTRRKHSQGIVELADRLQAESTLHFRRAEYLSARDREREAKERLWVALGREPASAEQDTSVPQAVPHIDWKLAADLTELENLAKDHRADLKAALTDVVQFESFYKRAKSNALPDLAVEYRFRDPGVYLSESDAWEAGDHHPNHTVALTLNMPLFPWLGSRGELLAARGRAQTARHQLRMAELELKREARAAWRGLKTAEESLELAEKRSSLERRKLREINRRYRDGQISGRELLLNQDDELRARQGLALARQSLVAAKIRLLLTQGNLVETILPEATR